ncbi:MAG: hypothetical protein IT443_10180 [Phycisphaeraceae bacterium]|nr:hypothetical protein [Phycisphaeraceae bacterium]
MSFAFYLMLAEVPHRLFLDPMALDGYWLALLIPPVVAMAVVYKGIRVADMSRLGWEAARLSLQVVGLMILAAAVLWVVAVWW